MVREVLVNRAIIGVDLGGTNLRTALVTPEGNVLEKYKEATDASAGYQRVIEQLIRSIERQRNNAGKRGLAVSTVGVGAPGVIHANRGVVVKSPNFPDWNNLPLKQLLETSIALPVCIENDANAAALGEQWRGAGKGIGSMILLTLGTGVGGGIILDGRIWEGADGMAGEIGHMTLVPEGRKCGCGNRGCLEMYASARGIVMSYREGRERSEVTAEQIYNDARAGDALARSVMSEMGRFLGIGMASLINIFNPEMIVVGGGVRDAWNLFIETARQEIRERAFAYPAERTQIVPSSLGDDAGMIGAAAAALQRT